MQRPPRGIVIEFVESEGVFDPAKLSMALRKPISEKALIDRHSGSASALTSREDEGYALSGKSTHEPDFEVRQNLIGLFGLLLKIDRRVNPYLYDKGATDNDHSLKQRDQPQLNESNHPRQSL